MMKIATTSKQATSTKDINIYTKAKSDERKSNRKKNCVEMSLSQIHKILYKITLILIKPSTLVAVRYLPKNCCSQIKEKYVATVGIRVCKRPIFIKYLEFSD